MPFALDSAKLLTKAPEQGEMKIAAFEKNATTGKFDFAVKIEGVNASRRQGRHLGIANGRDGC